MINSLAYDGRDYMRYSWRVIDGNKKEIALELPWVEVEKNEEHQRQAIINLRASRLRMQLEEQEKKAEDDVH